MKKKKKDRPQGWYRSELVKKAKRETKERDGNTCQWCGVKKDDWKKHTLTTGRMTKKYGKEKFEEMKRKGKYMANGEDLYYHPQIQSSHILPESKYKEYSYKKENLLTLCVSCHMKWHESPVEATEFLQEKFVNLFLKSKIWIQEYNKKKKTTNYKEEYYKIFNKKK